MHVPGNSPVPGTVTAGHMDTQMDTHSGPHTLSSLLPRTVSAHTSHITCVYTTPVAHTLHTHTHTHTRIHIPLTCMSLLYSSSCRRRRPVTLTPLPGICSHPQAQTHPLVPLTCSRTPTPARTQIPVHTVRTPRAPVRWPHSDTLSCSVTYSRTHASSLHTLTCVHAPKHMCVSACTWHPHAPTSALFPAHVWTLSHTPHRTLTAIAS